MGFLPVRPSSPKFDVEVEAGKNCRLVAIRAAGSVARERRKQRRKEAKAKGVEPEAASLVRDGCRGLLPGRLVLCIPYFSIPFA